MGTIRLLPPLLRDQIAAGEVCERPASVAKELIENALDAGAENITIWMERGGLSSLRVADDGCGMSAEDAELCFSRHATSKLVGDNLASIFTMGFRGEALAAISAVSKIKLITRLRSTDEGTLVVLDGGNIVSSVPTGCPEGTNITVSELFYNTPARLKFMKKDVSEAGMIVSVVEKAAFSHPEVAFRLYKDGKEVLHTPGDGNLLSAIYCIYGRDYANKLIPLQNEFNACIVKGYVCQPTAGRGNRTMQFFSVNGRPIRSKMLSAALDESYKNAMPFGKYAFCFLEISLPYDMVDVNVHPTKSEVRFFREKDVFDAIYYGIKTLLSNFRIEDISNSPQKEETIPRTFTSCSVVSSPVQSWQTELSTEQKQDCFTVASDRTPNTGTMQELSDSSSFSSIVLRSPKIPILYESAASAKISEEDNPSPPFEECKAINTVEEQTTLIDNIPKYRYVCEILRTYILAEGENELFIIDKHAAHERMLYEDLLTHEGESESQLLLTPYVCHLSGEEYAIILSSIEELDKSGFELEDFGHNSFLVRRIPMCLAGEDIGVALSEASQAIAEGKHDKRLTIRERLLYSISCRAAIKGGEHNSREELDMICSRVLEFQDIRFCPHGRPCAFRITKTELEKRFGRLGG